MHITKQSVTLQDVFRPVLNSLNQLARQLNQGGKGNQELDDLHFLLETLPLTTEEFGLAANRLKNAHRYVKAQEDGAARWELNALRQQLCKQVERADSVSGR